MTHDYDPPDPFRGMRIAWIGDAGTDGGVPKLCAVFLQSLLELGVKIDWFTTMAVDADGEFRWARHSNLRCFASPYAWKWNSWYGRNPKVAFIASFVKRIRVNRKLARCLLEEHRRKPYEAVIQFSQGELLALRPFARDLPILLYPQVHAAGELRWCRIEEPLAQRCEPWWWRRFRLLYLRYRAWLQKTDYNLATGVLGVSKRFTELISADYAVPRGKLGVVYHPIEITSPLEKRVNDGVVRLLFVGRISVRKGVDVLVESIPRLLREDDRIHVTLVGAGALWSNYEPLLKVLPKERCEWLRSLPNRSVVQLMQQSDVLLMPSSYEPGGIVVAEALSCGMILAASEDVGAAENLSPPIYWPFPARAVEAFCAAVKSAISAVRTGGQALREMARHASEARFGATAVAEQLLSEVARLTRK